MEKNDIDIKQDEDTIAFEEPAPQVVKKSKKVRSQKQLDQFRKAREKRMQMIADKKKAKEDNLREEAIKRLMEDEKNKPVENKNVQEVKEDVKPKKKKTQVVLEDVDTDDSDGSIEYVVRRKTRTNPKPKTPVPQYEEEYDNGYNSEDDKIYEEYLQSFKKKKSNFFI